MDCGYSILGGRVAKTALALRLLDCPLSQVPQGSDTLKGLGLLVTVVWSLAFNRGAGQELRPIKQDVGHQSELQPVPIGGLSLQGFVRGV